MQLDIKTNNYDTLLYRLIVIHIDIYMCVCGGGACEIEVANPKLIIELGFTHNFCLIFLLFRAIRQLLC